MTILDRPSPNFGPRRGEAGPTLVVLHFTGMESTEAALDRLCDPDCEVSSHYLICRSGQVFRLVDEAKRAWHAGEGRWAGREDVNSRSVGIELDNDGQAPFAEPLMRSLETLLADILGRHDMHPKAVIGHSDFAPDRKADPGRKFDWKRLAEKGLSIWPEPSLPGDFMRNAASFGYPVELGEALILDAFRQRFRPDASGPRGPADDAMMAGLARHFPADVGERMSRRVPSRPLRPMS
ncbi:N-acetylmuramoyl-L-alanine amidase [Alphaproteobacteria bacterium GH1-50]|uniref:N-acetylmuramoyl-L-alanine amidase n=1 Tax=Kangsaoukella pontilimi TaxID=2691042 RepID=A0A7C9INX4_9RHOB|nr:N-acetylmuramoyl-L-alanine amidase [Kangsaoukella pontilimi]MXQ06483.1 N-acetylmuramoyl-L-alanine amidase [Kangsaoukella pontilimi]